MSSSRKKEYFQGMVDLAVAFGANETEAKKALKDTRKLLSSIELMLKKARDRSKGKKFYSLVELQKYISWIDWTRLLTGMLPDSISLTDNTTILIKKPKFLKMLGELIDKYPKKTLASLRMWDIAIELTKYLPEDIYNLIPYYARLTDPWEIIYDMQDNSTKEQVTRDKFCAELIQQSSLSLALASYLASSTVMNTKAATEITQHLVEELILDIQELDWLDDSTREKAVKIISNITISIGFPEELSSIERLEIYYKDFDINTSHFFEAMLEDNMWLKKKTLQRFPSSEPDWFDLKKTYFSNDAHYNPYKKEILITGPFLHFLPMFSSNLPSYLKYSQLGSHELTHVVDYETDEEERKFIILDRWGNNKTEEIYGNKAKCVVNQYSSFNDAKYTKLQINGNNTNQEDIADIGGLKLAFRAYKRLSSNLSGPEPSLPMLQHYSPEQLFMISAANLFCEVPDIKKRFKRLQEDEHSLFEFRVKGEMMNSPDFAPLFSCLEGDSMNPINKCEVWL